MKISKPSNKVRWILVLPAIVLTFFLCDFLIFFFLIINFLPDNMKGDWLLGVGILICFLSGILVAPLHGKRFLAIVATLFIFTCLFPPWRATSGDRRPMGYGLVFSPPQKSRNGVRPAFSDNYEQIPVFAQIDFGRLFLEWAALAAVTGMAWMIVVKPARLNDDKAQQSLPPTGNPEK